MIIKNVNLLSQSVLETADAICFTSNGILTTQGRLVMGAGVAKQFKNYYKGIDFHAGKCVKLNGNVCQVVLEIFRSTNKPNLHIVAFPTKEHWKDDSSMELVERSTQQLVDITNNKKWKQVYLAAPGCGLGGLDFYKEVKPVIEKLLDDRFVITYGIIK
jgi:hypothetical protein